MLVTETPLGSEQREAIQQAVSVGMPLDIIAQLMRNMGGSYINLDPRQFPTPSPDLTCNLQLPLYSIQERNGRKIIAIDEEELRVPQDLPLLVDHISDPQVILVIIS